MDNIKNNNTNKDINKEGETSVSEKNTANINPNSNSVNKNQDTQKEIISPIEEKFKGKDESPAENENKEPVENNGENQTTSETVLSAENETELPAVPVLNEVEESEAELPHQPDPIRPDDIAEIEQKPPEKIITDEDIKKAKEIEPTTPVLEAPKEERLDAPPKLEQLEPLTPAKKKKILPETMDSSEVVVCLKDLRVRLKELLVRANKARKTHSEKNLDIIMEYTWRTQKVTNNDVERITGVKHSQATRYLKKLVKQGKLIRFGRYRYTFYKPIKK
ncbi:hypothetical protein DRH27_00200 [Candidatus Falkowbacteria bacterium]|nr:MAG: hypothetical protein DRH27_00200 [Candidatus Falkowbacteria bacterium]